MLGDLWLDIRHGLRTLAKSRGMTALVVLTLALGIAVNGVVFSYVNALLLRPATGVPSPGRLIELMEQNRKATGIERFLPLTYPDYLYYRDHAKTLSGLIVFDGDPEGVTWNRDGNGEVVQCQIVSGNFFSVLGVMASAGRTITPADDDPGAEPVITISNSFWRDRLGSDPNAIGKRLLLNGVGYRIEGVMPAGFEGLEIAIEPDFWVPMAMAEKITRDTGRLASWDSYWLFGVGRLKAGGEISQGRAEMNVLAEQIARLHPETHKDMGAVVYPQTLVPGPFRGYVGAFTGLLMVVVALVLGIACTNAANFMLARGVARSREMAIRSAMGASRGRLVRQVLVESTLLAGVSGCFALLLEHWAAPLLMSLKPSSLPIKIEVPTDWRVIAFTATVSLITGIVFGLAPALRGARTDLTPALKADSQGGSVRTSRLRTVLVVAQVATCAVLLVGAVLCVRSLLNARSMDPGFDVKQVAVATIDPGSVGYDESQRHAFYERLLGHVENLPGVTAASWVNHLPLSAAREQGSVSTGSGSNVRTVSLDVLRVGSRYFEAMGIALSRGRAFTMKESQKPGVAIINEVMARQLWPGRDPVGQQVKIRGDAGVPVVGVVKAGKYRTLGEDPLPVVYLPVGDMPRETLVVRTAGDPRHVVDSIRRAIHDVDPNLAATDLETMEQFMSLPLFPARVTGIALGTLGMLALVLAVGGLYGAISYTMSQRTREIGLRVALGAERKHVARLVLSYGLGIAGLGVAVGIAAAFGATRVLASLLYGIRADDATTLVGVSIGLIGVTLLACYLPARRAMSVNPLVALRYE